MISAAKATAEVFWTAFRAMPKKERNAIVEKLLADSEFLEDLMDIAILKQRKHEPSRSLDEYLVERKKAESNGLYGTSKKIGRKRIEKS